MAIISTRDSDADLDRTQPSSRLVRDSPAQNLGRENFGCSIGRGCMNSVTNTRNHEHRQEINDGKGKSVRKALGSFLFAGFLVSVSYVIFDLPAVSYWTMQIGWQLSRWRSFPCPYDIDEFSPLSLGSEFDLYFVPVFVFMILTTAVLVAIFHGISFMIALLSHKYFGWPRYWRDVRTRLHVQAAWAQSAIHGWWVWPTTAFVWRLLCQIGLAFDYAFYPIIGNGALFLEANFLAASLIFIMIASRILRSALIESVSDDELRCFECGYLLTGLPNERCPECGSDVECKDKERYGLFRLKRTPMFQRALSGLAKVVILALLLAPAWLPISVASLPRTWLRFVPSAIAPGWEVYNSNADAFPIRLDSVCLVKQGNSVAVIQFKRVMDMRADYKVAFWNDKSDMESRRAPDSSKTGKIDNKMPQSVSAGPWTLSYDIASENMIWLHRPENSNIDIASFTLDDLPEQLRFLETWDSQER
ncbi:MAG: hypothetical protein KDA54_13050 [Phycisphaerales bacterium]|nr:hypothetical protein [Phycisphaerales bacterium]